MKLVHIGDKSSNNPGAPRMFWTDAILQHCDTLKPHEKILAVQALIACIQEILNHKKSYEMALIDLENCLNKIAKFSEEEKNSIKIFFKKIFSDDPMRQIPLPTLTEGDADANRKAVQAVLNSLPPKNTDLALKFAVPDEDGQPVPITISPNAWAQWRAVHLISSNQPHLAARGREGFYACEILTFFHGTRGDAGVHINSLEVPSFTVTGDTVRFTSVSTINPNTVMGTAHVHPGGSEWSTLSDLDLEGFIQDSNRFHPNILFHAVNAKNAFFAPFPAQGPDFRYVRDRVNGSNSFGISPVEALSPLRAPIIAFYTS